MERKINKELLKWKRDALNKPLCLYGPRCVGKTYSMVDFGKKNFTNVVYFNTKNNELLKEIFVKEKVLQKLIEKLSFYSGESIFPEDSLIIFDNIEDLELLKLFKIFANTNYYIAMISSKKELIQSSKIEEYYYRAMSTLDFEEYLINSDKIQLVDFIRDSFETGANMPFHQMALESYYEYLETGGFPEVIQNKFNNSNSIYLDSIKQHILDIYKEEYTSLDKTLRCDDIYQSISNQLDKDNKKFQYGVIKKGARSKDYEDSINTLVSNLIVNRSYKLAPEIKSPLSSSKDVESFKLYYNDVGLLYSKLFVNKNRFMIDEDVKRTLIENDVANTLNNLGYSLYYYQSDGKAEVQFVIQTKMGKILPIELVNMKLVKAKALSLFMSKYNLEDAYRLTENNFKYEKGIKYIPIYAVFCLNNI